MQVPPAALLAETDEMLATLIEILEEQAEDVRRSNG
jgi:hypothetical protein